VLDQGIDGPDTDGVPGRHLTERVRRRVEPLIDMSRDDDDVTSSLAVFWQKEVNYNIIEIEIMIPLVTGKQLICMGVLWC
jgi:hypothetical protein